ncbi:hypothetical protein EDC01DRAFT_679433 [Geopyxis carbonaria]|nr:hypothetical protein EDC01DRAFT_679433 [Geopyxis carbonaria]
MSPVNDYCVLCGVLLVSDDYRTHYDYPLWCKDVRGIYKLDNETVIVTDIGTCTSDYDSFRLSSSEHGILPQEFCVKRPQKQNEDKEDKEEKACFPLHDACYRILYQMFPQGDLPLEAFYEVLSSVRYLWPSFRWEHDYGGAKGFEHHQLVRDRTEYIFYDPTTTPVIPLHNVAPQPAIKFEKTLVSAKDPFELLPPEVITAILCEMHFSDVSNLRLSSRRVTLLGFPSSFWRSRFRPDEECGYLESFLSQSSNGMHIDAQQIYHSIQTEIRSASEIGKILRNRQRTWRLLSGVAHLIDVVHKYPLCGSMSLQPTLTVRPSTTSCILPAGSDEGGLHQRHEVYTFFNPNEIDTVGVSFVKVFGRRFVSGLRGFSKKREVIAAIGYIHNDSEIVLERSREYQVLEVLVRLHRRGITAVSLGTQWVGECYGSISRLSMANARGLCVGVDATRIVSIACINEVTASTVCKVHPLEMAWDPSFPPKELDLNEHCYTCFGSCWNPFPEGYHPITYMSPQENDTLECVTAFLSGKWRICGLRFEYTSKRTETVGRTTGTACCFFLDVTAKENVKRLIIKIEDSQLAGFEIITSLNRKCVFIETHPAAKDVSVVELPPRDRVVQITGLYGCSFSWKGGSSLVSLGIISATKSTLEKSSTQDTDAVVGVPTYFRDQRLYPFHPIARGIKNVSIHNAFSFAGKCLHSVRAFICGPDHRFREEGDITGLRFDLVNGSIPECIGQRIGYESEEILFEDGEKIVDVDVYPSRGTTFACGRIKSLFLITSARRISWFVGGNSPAAQTLLEQDESIAEYRKSSLFRESTESKIIWVFSERNDLIILP